MNAQLQSHLKATSVPAASLIPVRAGLLQRKCACGGSPGASGECAECRKKRLTSQSVFIQPKLIVNRPGDRCEQEADRVADKVMRMPAPAIQRQAQPEDEEMLQAKPASNQTGDSDMVKPSLSSRIHAMHGGGQPLDAATRAFMEPRLGHDFSQVRLHTGNQAAKTARAVNALAYTMGQNVVFGASQYVPGTNEGKQLLAHELVHTLQQQGARPANSVIGDTGSSSAEEHQAEAITEAVSTVQPRDPVAKSGPMIQRRAAPYIKKVTVHLTPLQSADLEWEGTPPTDATGSDHFTVSTGKGYGDPGDPPGTCTRSCCRDPMTQCAPPWNQPSRVGACCTYYGNDFWTGTPQENHNGWQWWTPIQPYYSSRGIALHQHHTVTGQPIGHGCVRMEEPNAKRIYDYSNGRRTNVTIDGRAAPVSCEADRQCATGGTQGALEEGPGETRLAVGFQEAIPGLEGVMT